MYEVDMSSDMVDTGLILGTIMFVLGILAVVLLIYGYFLGRVLQKAGKPLWVGFVPIYNLIIVLEIVGRPMWWIILLLVSPLNLIFGFVVNIDLAKSYGKDTTYGVLLTLLPFIMLPVMALSSDIEYKGPSAEGKTGI